MTPEDKQKVKAATLAALDKAGASVDAPIHDFFGLEPGTTVRELMTRALNRDETYTAFDQQLSLIRKFKNPQATLDDVITDLTSDAAIQATVATYTRGYGSGALPPANRSKGPRP